ncbi:MAG: DUF1351 domain-containing protein [Bacilli bacterium]|nr:DUF1351 domain-containing protein [Bacilli bacterium]
MKETELQLVVKEKNLGSLVTNALTIKEKIEKQLPSYKAENYSIENIKQAEDDRALLNNTAKALNKQRIDLEKEFMAPFDTFKSIVDDTCKLIKEASSKLDEIVKTKEQEEKDEKRTNIQKYFDDNLGSLKDLINLEKIFNDRWLNKTYKIEDIYKEIDTELKKIRDCLSTVESLKSKYEVELKNHYIETLDLAGTIIRNNELLEKETKLVEQSKLAEIEKVKQEEKQLQEASTEKVITNVIDPEETYTLKITGKRSQMVALREFLKTNEMPFEKVE